MLFGCSGYVISYLASIPLLVQTYASSFLYLSGPSQLQYVDLDSEGKSRSTNITLEWEPSVLGLGIGVVSVGQGHNVWFYSGEKLIKKVNRIYFIHSFLKSVPNNILSRNKKPSVKQ